MNDVSCPCGEQVMRNVCETDESAARNHLTHQCPQCSPRARAQLARHQQCPACSGAIPHEDVAWEPARDPVTGSDGVIVLILCDHCGVGIEGAFLDTLVGKQPAIRARFDKRHAPTGFGKFVQRLRKAQRATPAA